MDLYTALLNELSTQCHTEAQQLAELWHNNSYSSDPDQKLLDDMNHVLAEIRAKN